MTTLAVVGHNAPPNPIDEATAPFANALDEAQNWLDGQPVTDEGQLKVVDAIHKDVKAALKAVKDGEKSAAAPIYDQWKAEKALWQPTIADLENMAKGLAGIMSDFKRQLAERLDAERRAANAEAERKRKEAEALAAQTTDIEAQRKAEALMQEAKETKKAAASVESVKGLRTAHKYAIDDHRAALHWIAQNDKDSVTAFIEEYVRRNHKAAFIDGVRHWTEKEAF